MTTENLFKAFNNKLHILDDDNDETRILFRSPLCEKDAIKILKKYMGGKYGEDYTYKQDRRIKKLFYTPFHFCFENLLKGEI